MIPLDLIQRHQILRLDGGSALVDTGCPFDIGRGRACELLGERWQPASTHAHVLDIVERQLGVSVDWLLGNETIGRGHLLLDGPAGFARFERAPIAFDPGAQAVAASMERGVPLIEMTLLDPRRTHRVVLDSGAALSYVPRAAVQGRSPLRSELDFYPSFGVFETPVWAFEVRVGTRDFTLEAGVLPPALARQLDPVSGGWILGSDFFRGRAVQIGYPDGVVLDGRSGAAA